MPLQVSQHVLIALLVQIATPVEQDVPCLQTALVLLTHLSISLDLKLKVCLHSQVLLSQVD